MMAFLVNSVRLAEVDESIGEDKFEEIKKAMFDDIIRVQLVHNIQSTGDAGGRGMLC
jgi:hypothetical protein